MWPFQEWNHLPSSSSLKGWGLPSNSNLKAIAECTLPQTYMEMWAFFGLLGHYRRLIKWFTCIAQPLSEYLAGKGASKKSEWVSLTEDAMKTFEHWNRHAWQLPSWCLLTTPSHSCQRLMHPKMDWGQHYHRSWNMVVPPHCLWQQNPDISWEKLSLHQTQVSAIKMGSYRAL